MFGRPHLKWFYLDRTLIVRVALILVFISFFFAIFSNPSNSGENSKAALPNEIQPKSDILDLSILKNRIENSNYVDQDIGVNIDEFLEHVREEDQRWNSPASLKENNDQGPLKYILYWNEAYGSTEYGFCCGQEPLHKIQCPNTNCYFTNNRSLFGEDQSQFDAILFHQRSLMETDLPKKRLPHQRYIMFMLESAQYNMGFESLKWNSFFNWTMTYRRDSDIPFPYGEIAINPKNPLPYPEGSPELDSWIQTFGASHSHLARGRTKKVAWFVSNCDSQSNREKFVTALATHIQVDIFGQCGPKKCPRSSNEDCWKMVEKDYKFYLAFENSICVDYVTEKFFNSISHQVIPIVLGGADYSGMAPKKSYISVHDLDNDPARLARSLKKLDENDELFAEYFWWKDFYQVKMADEDRIQAFCKICQKLHDPNQGESVYSDLNEWWDHKSKCRRARVKL